MEQLMQYIWQHRLLPTCGLTTVDGETLNIIDPGRLNTDSGPDFFNAKVRIGRRVWAGDVEIHVRASDWHRHGHDGDPAYESVILHVVNRDDTMIKRGNGEVIPQLLMECNPRFSEDYARFVGVSSTQLPCAERILSLPRLKVYDWLDALAYERIHDKVERIDTLLGSLSGNWEETCFVTVARALGMGLNSEPFERTARSVSLKILRKHSDSLVDLEAILMGQGGLLDRAPENDLYAGELRARYRFMATKFDLVQPRPMIWKMSRMRPHNLPYRRMAFLATMLYGGFRMLNDIVHTETVEDAESLFRHELQGYWATRYTFGPMTEHATPSLGKSAIRTLIINAVAPLMAAYGINHGDIPLLERAATILQALPPEKNRLTEMFTATGIPVKDAFTTQALIQLRRAYCEPHKCLYCRFGHPILADKATGKT